MLVNHWKTSMRCSLGMKKDEKVMVVRRKQGKISLVNYWDRNIPTRYWWALPSNFTLSRQSSSQKESVKYFQSCIQVFGDFAVFIVRPLWRTNAINEQGRVILVKTVNADLFCFAFIQNSDLVIKKFYLLEAHLTR